MCGLDVADRIPPKPARVNVAMRRHLGAGPDCPASGTVIRIRSNDALGSRSVVKATAERYGILDDPDELIAAMFQRRFRIGATGSWPARALADKPPVAPQRRN